MPRPVMPATGPRIGEQPGRDSRETSTVRLRCNRARRPPQLQTRRTRDLGDGALAESVHNAIAAFIAAATTIAATTIAATGDRRPATGRGDVATWGRGGRGGRGSRGSRGDRY